MLRSVLLASTCLVLAACSNDGPSVEGETVQRVEAAPLVLARDHAQRHYAGRIEAADQVSFGFEVAGRVSEVAVDIGDTFEVGDLLARLDPTDFELALRRAEAELETARASAREAEQTLVRTQALAEREAASQADLDQAVARSERTRAQASALAAAVNQARERLNDTRLIAPYAGRIAERRIEPSQTIAAGQPAFAIEASATGSEAVFHVSASDLRQVGHGQSVEIDITALELTATAQVTNISGSANAQSLYEVRTTLVNAPETLAPGMAVSVTMPLQMGDEAILAPHGAIIAGSDNAARVVVIDAETGMSERREVRILAVIDEGLVLSGDLEVGELVASRGAQRLIPGTPVEIVGPAAPTARFNQ